MIADLKSIRLDFSKEHTSFDFTATVQGRKAVVQSALVHAGVQKGSYLAFPEGGTNLPKFVTGYGVALWGSAAHAGNFAALASKKFINKFIPNDDADRITAIRLSLESLEMASAKYIIQIVFPDGEVIGLESSAPREKLYDQ